MSSIAKSEHSAPLSTPKTELSASSIRDTLRKRANHAKVDFATAQMKEFKGFVETQLRDLSDPRPGNKLRDEYGYMIPYYTDLLQQVSADDDRNILDVCATLPKELRLFLTCSFCACKHDEHKLVLTHELHIKLCPVPIEVHKRRRARILAGDWDVVDLCNGVGKKKETKETKQNRSKSAKRKRAMMEMELRHREYTREHTDGFVAEAVENCELSPTWTRFGIKVVEDMETTFPMLGPEFDPETMLRQHDFEDYRRGIWDPVQAADYDRSLEAIFRDT